MHRGAQLSRRALLDQGWATPGQRAQALLEVAPGAVGEVALHARRAERLGELQGGGGGAGPAVSGYEVEDTHRGILPARRPRRNPPC
jgi:hypothetical protein